MPLNAPLRAAAILLSVAVASVGPSVTQGAAPGYQVQVGVIESDNIERLPTGGSDETVGVEELGFTWHDKRPYLDADIDADVSHLDYFQHSYGAEFIGNFLGLANFNLAPQVFSWSIADNFGQAPLDPLAPVTPGNRENINYFSTGPKLTLPLGQSTSLGISGQYGRMDYQHSPLDNANLTGDVGLTHELSQYSNISINARAERVDFANDQLNPDYDRQEAFVRFDTKGSRTELGVDLGYSHLQMLGTGFDTPLARLELSRRVSPNSTVGIAFGHDYSDGADSFRLVQAVGGATLNTLPLLAAGAPFESNYATLQWNFNRTRTTVNLAASYYRDRFQTDTALNNERTVIDGRAARQITPTLQLSLTEYLVRWEFTGESATATDTGLQLAWRVGNRVSIFLAYYLSKGSSNVPTFQYTENRLWLSIGYGVAAEVPPGPAPVRLPGVAPQ